MSKQDDNTMKPKPTEKTRLERKLSVIPFRGWAVRIGDRTLDATPNRAELDRAVKQAKDGRLEERAFSGNSEALARALLEEAGNDLTKFHQLSVEYHAARVAFLVLKGWDDFPIEVMTNGDMRDGQHRWLAANYLGREKVEVVEIDR